VSTGVLPAKYALAMSATLNFAGALAGTSVATTIAKGIADSQHVVPAVIAAALLAAITWDLLTWWFGIPSSTSHTLLGGLSGAVVAHAGFKALDPIDLIKWKELLGQIEDATDKVELVAKVIGSTVMKNA